MRKRLLKISLIVLGIVAVAILGLCLWVRSELLGSLAQLDGERQVSGLASEVKVERDGLGIPTIHASSRKDLAFATGFVHGQDRFFQMDILRRNSAGELAEVAGPDVLAADKRVRVNRFRDVARRVVDKSSGEEREVLLAYADGVNAGLAALGDSRSST